MKVSKNQLVCARCHFVGLTSGIDWIAWSSGERLAASASDCCRITANRSRSAVRSVMLADSGGAISSTLHPSLALIVAKRLVAALFRERFTRQQRAGDIWPVESRL